jgi:hypothetical protein
MLMLEGCTTASGLDVGVRVGALVLVAVGALVPVAVGAVVLDGAPVGGDPLDASVGASAPGALQPVRASAARTRLLENRAGELDLVGLWFTAKICGSSSLTGLSIRRHVDLHEQLTAGPR